MAKNEIDELMQVVKGTAFNVQNVSEQMGLLSERVKDMSKKITQMAAHQDDTDDRIAKIEDTYPVTRVQANNIRKAIHRRASELLGIERDEYGHPLDDYIDTDKLYFGRFVSRIYADARKESRLGTPYYSTYKKDYPELIEYIAAWYPGEGVEGLKTYYDKRRVAG